MSLTLRNLSWVRGLKMEGVPAFGQRLFEMFSDVQNGVGTLEQQTNSNLNGTPEAPPQPQAIQVVPHPMGVDVSITHQGEFYQGIKYEVDYADNQHFQGARTHDLGASRNAVLPLGQWNGYYQVRALYPGGQSSPPVVFGGGNPQMVRGGSTSTVSLLPTQAASTTQPGQPPGFGTAFRSKTGAPPTRVTK